MKKILNTYNVCFLGRTGNGKSSLINRLFGTSLPTDPLVPCTKVLSTTTVLSNELPRRNAISIFDTPGIGEFSSVVPYQRYYEYAVSQSHCIVLVTTLDRNDAPAQRLLMQMRDFLDQRKNPRFVIALNHIDSRVTVGTADDVVWDDENNLPTELRQNQIAQRITMIQEKFADKFLPFDVVPECAMRNYGIENLKKTILNK